MISKRKREENELKRSSTSPKSESLPLESQELTNYHVVQLQESNRQYKSRIEELENRISEMIGAFENIQGGDRTNDESLSSKFDFIIKQKDDEILSLRNENQRLNMQNVFKKFYSSKNTGLDTNSTIISGRSTQANKQGVSLEESTNDNSANVDKIDITVSDIQSKLIEREKQISELNAKCEEVSQENLELRRNLAIYAPCEDFKAKLKEGEAEDSKFCKCVRSVIGEIFELRTQLNSEKLKFATLLENELLKDIRDFLGNQKNCEEHNKATVKELEEIKNRYNSLRQDYFSMENTQKTLELRDKEQRKKIRELELEKNKMELEKVRVAEFIKTVNLKLEKEGKEEIVENIMNEYEELSNAFEEKSSECDNLRQRLEEKEKEFVDLEVGIDEIKQVLKEMETVKILYEEKLSLVRKTNKSEPLKENSSFEENQSDQETKISEFLKRLLLISQLSDNSQEYSQTKLGEEKFDNIYKSLIEQKSISEKLKLDLEFYKSENLKLMNKIKNIEKEECDYNTTISILKNRVHYILNIVNKLTNLEINFDNSENNKHLQIDDQNKEINTLKLENQELLTLMKCSVCRDKVKDTVINRCGHLFCRECIDRNLSSRNRKCPLCHITFDKNDTGKIFLH